MQSRFTFDLPPSALDPSQATKIETNSSIVILGANGSGKTRLGAWIETQSNENQRVHRVSAQKSLTMPDSSSTTSVEQAETDLLYGTPGGSPVNRLGNKWASKPHTSMLTDYHKLMVALFSDDYERTREFRIASKESAEKLPIPETKLDIVQRIWQSLLPHRELVISSNKVEVKTPGSDTKYNASEMSDGERVIFYLIGQCLCVKPDSIIVIDEPEMHVHKSIQAPLWDAIEQARQDCLFIYITHDLEFAMSRVGAPKVCLFGFDGSQWNWSLAPDPDQLPDPVQLQLIGGRKPVLFAEGDSGSLDHFLFRHLYPAYTVVPLGGCQDVIHATMSFSSLNRLHHLECVGIVDRDFRSDEMVSALRQKGIFTLPVHEIENLLLLESVVTEFAILFEITEIASLIANVKGLVFSRLREEMEIIASRMVVWAIEAQFKTFDAKARGAAALAEAAKATTDSLDVAALYTTAKKRIQAALDNQDYLEALKLYTNKGLLAQTAKVFGIQSSAMLGFVTRFIKGSRGDRILAAMMSEMPMIKDETTAALA